MNLKTDSIYYRAMNTSIFSNVIKLWDLYESEEKVLRKPLSSAKKQNSISIIFNNYKLKFNNIQ